MRILYRKQSLDAQQAFKIYQDTYELDRSKNEVDFIAGFNAALKCTDQPQEQAKGFKVWDAHGDTIDVACPESLKTLPLFLMWNKRTYKYKHQVASDGSQTKKLRHRYQLTTEPPDENFLEIPYLEP